MICTCQACKTGSSRTGFRQSLAKKNGFFKNFSKIFYYFVALNSDEKVRLFGVKPVFTGVVVTWAGLSSKFEPMREPGWVLERVQRFAMPCGA